MKRRILLAMLLGLTVTQPAHARRQDDAPTSGAAGARELLLTWRAPAECPDAAAVEAQFTRLLGGASHVPQDKRVRARAIARATRPNLWSVEIDTDIDGIPGHRRVESDSCSAVASVTALILALAIDPDAAARALEIAPPPPPAPAPPPVIARAPPPPPPPAVRVVVRAIAAVVIDLLPQTALAGGIGVGARRGRWEGEIALLVSEEEQGGSPRPSAGGQFRLVAGAARGCGAFSEQPVRTHVCAGAEWERIGARGFGVTAPGSGSSTVGAGLLTAGGALPLGPHLELSLEITGAFRAARPTFALDPVGDVFTVPAASAYATLGLAVTF